MQKTLTLLKLITLGIKDLQLKYFQALKFTDLSKNKNVNWSGFGVWKILHTGQISLTYDVMDITERVCSRLVNEDYMFQSKLAFIIDKQMTLPWIPMVMNRLLKC